MFRTPEPPTGDPASPSAGAPRFLPFSKAGPLGVVVFLALVSIALVALLGQLGRGSKLASPKEPAAAPEPGHDVLVREPKIEFLTDGDLAAQYPTTVREELEAELEAWFQTPGREMISDRQAVEEPEWVRHLLSPEVRPRLERLPAWVFGSLSDPARVTEEPGGHRGTLVQVWGEVRSVEPAQLPTEPATPAWRLRLDDPDGRAWTVLTLREPAEDVEAGSWVRAAGAFVKMRPVEEGRPSFLVLAAQAVIPSFPPVAVKAIDPSWAAEVEDQTIERSQRRPGEEDAFWLLMNYVRTMGPEGYRAKVASGELKVVDRTDTRGATELAQKPALHRFELVRLKVGLPKPTGEGSFVTEQDLLENVGNIRSVFRGFALDDQGRVLWVMTPFPADAFRFAGARLGLIEGFFYKRIAVEKKGGDGLYWMPVIVATAIVPIDTSPKETAVAEWAAWIVVGGAASCAVLFVVLVLRRRRERREAIRRHVERLNRRAATGAGDTGAARTAAAVGAGAGPSAPSGAGAGDGPGAGPA